MRVTLHAMGGQQEYKHENGEISTVMIEVAGMGMRKVQIANLAPEIPDSVVRAALTKYGDVRDITEEKWARQYRYAVSNGIRVANMSLKTHVPSHLVIAGTRVLVSYEGQPVTCYNCNATGHQYMDCPHRRSQAPHTPAPRATSWADMVQYGRMRHTRNEEEYQLPLNRWTKSGTWRTRRQRLQKQVRRGVPLSR
jgi:hypothetical protein